MKLNNMKLIITIISTIVFMIVMLIIIHQNENKNF